MTGARARYTAAEALRLVLQDADVSDSDSSDLPSISDSESDHVSETNEQPDKQEASSSEDDAQLIRGCGQGRPGRGGQEVEAALVEEDMEHQLQMKMLWLEEMAKSGVQIPHLKEEDVYKIS